MHVKGYPLMMEMQQSLAAPITAALKAEIAKIVVAAPACAASEPPAESVGTVMDTLLHARAVARTRLFLCHQWQSCKEEEQRHQMVD